MENELENIAERGICYCGKPNLLWQPRRNLFRCGWCGKDYQVTEALNLARLTDGRYEHVMRLRNDVTKRSGLCRKSRNSVGKVKNELD